MALATVEEMCQRSELFDFVDMAEGSEEQSAVVFEMDHLFNLAETVRSVDETNGSLPVNSQMTRCLKRQRAVRALVRRCSSAGVELPELLKDLVEKVNTEALSAVPLFSKRTFETMMHDCRHSVNEKLLKEQFII